MTYTPNEWNTGDIITAEKLNHVEGGIAANALFYPVHITLDGSTLTADKTYQQIADVIMERNVIPVVFAELDGLHIFYPFSGFTAMDGSSGLVFRSETFGASGHNISSISATEIVLKEDDTVVSLNATLNYSPA